MTSRENQLRFKRREIPASTIGEEVVIFDDRVGKYFATGLVGAGIWNLLADPITLDALCAALTETYDIDTATCLAETEAFLERLRGLDLVEVEGA